MLILLRYFCSYKYSLILSMILTICLILIITPSISAEVNEIDERKIFNIFRTEIAKELENELTGGVTKIQDTKVMSLTKSALNNADQIFDNLSWIDNNNLNLTVTRIKVSIDSLIRVNSKELDMGSLLSKIAVSQYLTEVLDIPFTVSEKYEVESSLYSYHRLLIGGAFAHSDEGPAQGIINAALLVRTRLWADYSKIKVSEINPTYEKGYLDLIVDAQFITANSFNDIKGFDDNVDSATSVLLNSVRSSKLSMGLVLASPSVLADHGNVGALIRFLISTQEGSNDVFRRFEIGFRIENRSFTVLREASAEFLFTVDKAPGSLEDNSKSRKLFGTDRFILNFELPMLNKHTGGLFVQFNSEWPIGRRDQIYDILDEKNKFRNPPIFQFRIGATFDAVKLLKPIFGF